MTTRLTTQLAAGLLVAATLAASCSSEGLETRSGNSVLVPSVTKAVFVSKGGGLVQPTPTGAPCDPQKFSYTLDLAASRLAWSTCTVTGDYQSPSSYMPATGERELTPTELAQAKAALAGVVVSDRRVCGAYKPTFELQVASPQDQLVYGDDFYGCTAQYQQYVVSEGLDTFNTTLGALAKS